MLMNAQPRAVSNSYQTFIPYQNVESCRQGIFEMTDRDLGAWGTLGPAAQPDINSTDWNLLEGYGDGGNYSVSFTPDSYGMVIERDSSFAQIGSTGVSRTIARSSAGLRHPRTIEALSPDPLVYEIPHSQSTHTRNLASNLGGHGQEWIATNMDASNNILSRQQMTFDGATYRIPRSYESRSYFSPPSSAIAMPSFSMSDSDTCDSLGSPNSIYNECSTLRAMPTVPTVPMAVSFTSLTVQGSPVETSWWDGNDQSMGGISNFDAMLPFSCDGLTRSVGISTWLAGPDLTLPWSQQSVPFSTVSPQALTLRCSSGKTSSPLTTCREQLQLTTSIAQSLKIVSSSTLLSRKGLNRKPSTELKSSQGRQKLPDQPLRGVIIPTLGSNDQDKSNKSRSINSKSKARLLHKEIPKVIISDHKDIAKQSITSSRNLPLKRVAPKPSVETAPSEGLSKESPALLAKTKVESNRGSKDEFLVRSKRAGMSYKDIRRQGGFTEAESTLRGRFRTLTKEKKERVRKPEWEQNDIRLLKRAVRKLAKGSDPSRVKVPWKQVSDYILNHGGSYHFGNATCRKRWDELQGVHTN